MTVHPGLLFLSLYSLFPLFPRYCGHLPSLLVMVLSWTVTTFPSPFSCLSQTVPWPFFPSQFPEDCPIYSPSLTATSPSLPPLLFFITCRCGVPSISQTSDSFMLTSLSLLSCTILQLIVAGLSQALPVFNPSYVRQLSFRLDLLYQYQAIVSEVPHDWYTTNFSYLWIIDPQANCLTSPNPTQSHQTPWLHPLRDATGRVDRYVTYPHVTFFTDKNLTSTMPRAWV